MYFFSQETFTIRGKAVKMLSNSLIARESLRGALPSIGRVSILIILALGFHVASGGLFLTLNNISSILYQASIHAVIAAGMTFVILTGRIDLSISAIVSICAVFGLTVSNIHELSYIWVIFALLIGLGFGLINGFMIGWLRLPDFVVTLGSLSVFLGVARQMSGDMSVYNPGLPYKFIGTGDFLGMPLLAIVALLVIIASWFILKRTILGAQIYLIGCNEAAAHMSGVNVRRIITAVYGISGLLAGVAAIMLSAKVQGANAMQVGHAYTFTAIAAVLLGGTSIFGGIGSIWGTVMGVLTIMVLSNGLILLGVPDVWQHVSKGVIIIVAVSFDGWRNTDRADA